jgi:hypothetical protein
MTQVIPAVEFDEVRRHREPEPGASTFFRRHRALRLASGTI